LSSVPPKKLYLAKDAPLKLKPLKLVASPTKGEDGQGDPNKRVQLANIGEFVSNTAVKVDESKKKIKKLPLNGPKMLSVSPPKGYKKLLASCEHKYVKC
ncbi:unnamed protein product, partial [Amoebophrya sp. A120]